MRGKKTTIRTTCPRDCYDSCGISAIMSDDGTLRQLVGDAEHHMARGRLCPKCALAYNGAWRDTNQRLTTPLRRIGGKGKAEFESVSWDDALKDIANRLQSIVQTNPSSSILHTHYTGTCAVLGGLFPLRFFKRLGATEVEPDTVCNNAAHASLNYTFGESCEGFDPDTVKDSHCVIVWGANPSHSAPHVASNWLKEARATVVHVDPIANESAKSADIHLQLRPGTDAALAFGLVHIALRENKIDLKFLEHHTIGWNEVLPDVMACTPDVAAEKTGLRVEDIERVAASYLSGPSLIWLGQGLQRQRLGGNIYRSCALLATATGNLAKPGAGLLFLNGPNTRAADIDYVAGDGCGTEEPPSISHMDLADILADGSKASALFCWNNNIVASNPVQTKLRDALTRDDLFQVCVELFETDTTAYADYVLPAASFLEYDDLLFPYFHNSVSAIAKVQPPPGLALPNAEIFRRLAKAMGFAEESLFESDRSVIDHVLSSSDAKIDFDALKKVGTVRVYDAPRIQFESLSFSTPSGKIEIASSAAEANGHWRSPRPEVDEPTKEGKIRVLSPASNWTLNSSYGNDARIRKRLGEQSVLLNRLDAERLEIEDGQSVLLRNELGDLRLRAEISQDTLPGVALVWKGNWPMYELKCGGNINLLNQGEKTDMGESSCVHNVEVELVPM